MEDRGEREMTMVKGRGAIEADFGTDKAIPELPELQRAGGSLLTNLGRNMNMLALPLGCLDPRTIRDYIPMAGNTERPPRLVTEGASPAL